MLQNMGNVPPTSTGKTNRFQPPKKEHVILNKGRKTTNLPNPMTKNPGLMDRFAPHLLPHFLMDCFLWSFRVSKKKKKNTVGCFIPVKPSWIDPCSPPWPWRIVPPAHGGQFSQMVVEQGCKVSVLEGPKWCSVVLPKVYKRGPHQ